MQRALRGALLKYKLHRDQELFESSVRLHPAVLLTHGLSDRDAQAVWLVGQNADLTNDLTNAVRHGTRKPATGLNSEALWRTRTADPLLTMEVLYQLS